jgi:hypothetical protein
VRCDYGVGPGQHTVYGASSCNRSRTNSGVDPKRCDSP